MVRDTSLKSALGVIPKQKREASSSVKRLLGVSPGPGDYSTLNPRERPLTSSMSHSVAGQHFNRYKKDTMTVHHYDRAYERSYKNNIGPGPHAYSRIYLTRETDRFRKTAFPK